MENFTGFFFSSSSSLKNNFFCRVFTKEKGCIFVSFKKTKKKHSRSFFYSPMALCSFLAKKKGGVFFLNSATLLSNPSLSSSIEKAPMLIVLGEVLFRVLEPGYKNHLVFSFIKSSLCFFSKKKASAFFLFFLIGLFRSLGYSIKENISSSSSFLSFSEKQKNLFFYVLKTPFNKQNNIFLKKEDRKLFVGLMFDCYISCFDNFKIPRGYRVLEEIYEE